MASQMIRSFLGVAVLLWSLAAHAALPRCLEGAIQLLTLQQFSNPAVGDRPCLRGTVKRVVVAAKTAEDEVIELDKRGRVLRVTRNTGLKSVTDNKWDGDRLVAVIRNREREDSTTEYKYDNEGRAIVKAETSRYKGENPPPASEHISHTTYELKSDGSTWLYPSFVERPGLYFVFDSEGRLIADVNDRATVFSTDPNVPRQTPKNDRLDWSTTANGQVVVDVYAGGQLKNTYAFDEGLLIFWISTHTREAYTYPKFDKKGNWLVKETRVAMDDNGIWKAGSLKKTVTRTIDYWK